MNSRTVVSKGKLNKHVIYKITLYVVDYEPKCKLLSS